MLTTGYTNQTFNLFYLACKINLQYFFCYSQHQVKVLKVFWLVIAVYPKLTNLMYKMNIISLRQSY